MGNRRPSEQYTLRVHGVYIPGRVIPVSSDFAVLRRKMHWGEKVKWIPEVTRRQFTGVTTENL